MTESAATAEMGKIADGETPLASNPVWALLNLILAICTGIISAVLLAGYFGRKDERDENEDEDEDNTERKGGIRILSLIPTAASVIAFILTENMSNPMVFTDRWTILMAVILLVQAAVAILAKKEVNEDEATEEAAEGLNA